MQFLHHVVNTLLATKIEKLGFCRQLDVSCRQILALESDFPVYKTCETPKLICENFPNIYILGVIVCSNYGDTSTSKLIDYNSPWYCGTSVDFSRLCDC